MTVQCEDIVTSLEPLEGSLRPSYASPLSSLSGLFSFFPVQKVIPKALSSKLLTSTVRKRAEEKSIPSSTYYFNRCQKKLS